MTWGRVQGTGALLWIGYPGRKGEHLYDWASSSILPDKRKDESEAQAAVGEEAAAAALILDRAQEFGSFLLFGHCS